MADKSASNNGTEGTTVPYSIPLDARVLQPRHKVQGCNGATNTIRPTHPVKHFAYPLLYRPSMGPAHRRLDAWIEIWRFRLVHEIHTSIQFLDPANHVRNQAASPAGLGGRNAMSRNRCVDLATGSSWHVPGLLHLLRKARSKAHRLRLNLSGSNHRTFLLRQI